MVIIDDKDFGSINSSKIKILRLYHNITPSHYTLLSSYKNLEILEIDQTYQTRGTHCNFESKLSKLKRIIINICRYSYI